VKNSKGVNDGSKSTRARNHLPEIVLWHNWVAFGSDSVTQSQSYSDYTGIAKGMG
jgi:hypothetical protein